VATAILQLSKLGESLTILQPSSLNVERWMVEWQTTPEEKSQFLKLSADSYSQIDQLDESYGYLLRHLQILSPDSPAASTAALETISAALRYGSVFNFDPLLKIDAVVNLKDHELIKLLRIFLSGGVSEYTAYEASHASTFDEYNLPRDGLSRKICLLSLTTLSSQNIGRDITYADIATALNVEEATVESWIIDVIRTGLVAGKISQPLRTFRVTRSTTRSFERTEWEALERRLVAWKTGLSGVLEVVNAARRTVSGNNTTVERSAQAIAAQ